MTIELTEDERDAIAEIFNVGVNAAAVTLSEMVSQEVDLSLPGIEIQSRADLAERDAEVISAIHQSFEAPFGGGRAILTFPEVKSLNLVNALMGEDVGEDQLSDMQEEALTEVGNIILNSCLASLSDMARKEIDVTVPRFQRAHSFVDLLGPHEGEDGVMVLSVQFGLRGRNIDGQLLFILEIQRLRSFVAVVEATLMGA